MQKIWYAALRLYVKIGLLIYFRKVLIDGKENIPKGPVIFAANHQNAFLDALMIVCFTSSPVHFLTRADIFKKPFFRWVLSTMNMIPVYRMRDGRQSLSENQKTFDECYTLFKQNEGIAIFPEGNHGEQRRLRPLSKGFARIAFDALEKDPAMTISIIPVGINYSDHQAFHSSVKVIFGKALVANDYFHEPLQLEVNHLKSDLANELKNVITHVEDTDRYTEVIHQLEQAHADYLDPVTTNFFIDKIRKGEKIKSLPAVKKKDQWHAPFYYLSLIINFIPLAIWRQVRGGIEDRVFVASLKFGIGIFLFPLFYFFIAGILLVSFAWPAAVVWLLISFPSMLFKK